MGKWGRNEGDNIDQIGMEESVYMSKMEICEETDKELPDGVIGVLVGPLMEVTVGDSNNNDRDYTFEFIDEHIVKSEYAQEMMRYKCLFGEPSHPIDRFKINLMNVSHSVVEMWWNEDNTKLMGKIYVYDTPAGRIIMTLVRAGSYLGISIRARGDIIRVRGRRVPNPKTYIFKAFDIVPNPGFNSARLQEINESDDDTVEESLITLINRSSREELNVISRVLNSLDEDVLGEVREVLEGRMADTNDADAGVLDEEIVSLKEEVFRLREQLRERAEHEPQNLDEDSHFGLEALSRDLMKSKEEIRRVTQEFPEKLLEFENRLKRLDEEAELWRSRYEEACEENEDLMRTLQKLDEEDDYEPPVWRCLPQTEESKVKYHPKRSFLNESVADRPVRGSAVEDLSEEEVEVGELVNFIKGMK